MGLFGKLLGIGGTLAGGALGGMVGQPLLGAKIGGALGGAVGGSLASKKGGRQAVAAQQQSTADQQAYVDRVNAANSADFSPYVAAGGRGLGSAEALLYGTDGDPATRTQNLRDTPGYNFRYDEGLRALDSSAANNGSLLSGNQRIEAMRYGQGMADQTYQQEFNNRMRVGQFGLTAAGALASNRSGLASGYLDSTKQLGETTAANAIQRGEQNKGLIDTLTTAAGSIFEKTRRQKAPTGSGGSYSGGVPDPRTGIVYPYSGGNGSI